MSSSKLTKVSCISKFRQRHLSGKKLKTSSKEVKPIYEVAPEDWIHRLKGLNALRDLVARHVTRRKNSKISTTIRERKTCELTSGI